jgi:hypothetical protein
MEIILSDRDEGERRFRDDANCIRHGRRSQYREHGMSGAEKGVGEHRSDLADPDEGDGLLHEPQATGVQVETTGSVRGRMN